MITRLERCLWAALATLLTSCGGGSGNSAGVDNSAPAIVSQPSDQTVAMGQAATFSVSATGAAPLSYQWQRDGAAIAGATSPNYTTGATTAIDDGATFTVVVSNAQGSATSAPVKLHLGAAAVRTDVVTYKNDSGRTGQNLTESALTLANVNSTSFGLLRTLAVDGKVDAQPLYLSQLQLAGAVHNVVFVATEHDSVYAFDADTGGALWKVSLLPAGENLSDTRGCGQVTPEIGITSTPVIARAGAGGILYTVAMSKDGSGAYHQRVHALDVTSGAELPGSPVEVAATFPTASGAPTSFEPGQYEERAALLLSGGTLYTSWTSHCDSPPYTGWILAYNAATLAPTGILNVSPNAISGAAIWMSGGGPAADATGAIYVLTGNGSFETTLDANGFPNKQDYGNSFLRIATGGGTLAVADYFALTNGVAESNADIDLGSGGEMLLPDLADAGNVVRHLVVGAGKDGNIYVVNRDSMGKFSASGNQIWQELDGVLSGGVWATPAYFNSTIYYADNGGTLKAFKITGAKLSAAPTSQTPSHFGYPGSAPAVSANGATNGIVWAHENSTPGVLHAYDAADVSHELYNSNQAASNRDHFGAGNKFITPAIADGKVFVGTTNSVAVFGLLH
jgi:hypothetical protein